MNSRRNGGDDLWILLIVLIALFGAVAWSAIGTSEGQQPIPLPTAPTVVP